MRCSPRQASVPRWPGPLPLPSPVVIIFLLCLAGSALASRGAAQEPSTALAAATLPADPADVASPDAIVAAVYDVISGPAGQARDWDRFASLFLPEARLVSVGVNREGAVARRVMTPGEYREAAGTSLEQNGFFEEEIGNVQEEFGPVVHRFSAYQSRRSLDDPEPFARGVNSFQLLHDGSRWWVLTIFWTQERPDLPIPGRYLGGDPAE